MIRLYYFHTPNVFKILIALGEMGLQFEERFVDILNGGHLEPSFLAVSPNNKVPAIEDLNPEDGGPPIAIFESAAILLYLSEKTGKLMPSSARSKIEVVKWLIWQAANQGPNMGALGHFMHYSRERIPYAVERYSKEVRRQFGVLNTRLADRDYLAGAYSIADVINYPWLFFGRTIGITFDEFPNLTGWFERISQRPAVREALTEARMSGLAKAAEEVRSRAGRS